MAKVDYSNMSLFSTQSSAPMSLAEKKAKESEAEMLKNNQLKIEVEEAPKAKQETVEKKVEQVLEKQTEKSAQEQKTQQLGMPFKPKEKKEIEKGQTKEKKAVQGILVRKILSVFDDAWEDCERIRKIITKESQEEFINRLLFEEVKRHERKLEILKELEN